MKPLYFLLRVFATLTVMWVGWLIVCPILINNDESDLLVLLGGLVKIVVVPFLIYLIAIDPIIKYIKNQTKKKDE